MFYVYVLRSLRTSKLYKRQTQDLTKRLKAHNQGKTKSTKSGIPWELVYWEEAPTIEEALIREKYFKTAAGRRFIEKKIGRVGGKTQSCLPDRVIQAGYIKPLYGAFLLYIFILYL